MQMLIKNKTATENEWQRFNDFDSAKEAISDGLKVFITLQDWKDNTDNLNSDLAKGNIGLFVSSEEINEEMPSNLLESPVIALEFPVFTDGRAYSLARELRQVHSYKGEIRAVGEVLVDQVDAMERCGFDAFELSSEAKAEAAIAAFSDFSEKYQADLTEKQPIYHRK